MKVHREALVVVGDIWEEVGVDEQATDDGEVHGHGRDQIPGAALGNAPEPPGRRRGPLQDLGRPGDVRDGHSVIVQ